MHTSRILERWDYCSHCTTFHCAHWNSFLCALWRNWGFLILRFAAFINKSFKQSIEGMRIFLKVCLPKTHQSLAIFLINTSISRQHFFVIDLLVEWVSRGCAKTNSNFYCLLAKNYSQCSLAPCSRSTVLVIDSEFNTFNAAGSKPKIRILWHSVSTHTTSNLWLSF